MKQAKTEKQIIGKIGEDTACKFLVKQGYKIVDRNYLKKWGEIDIVAQKSNKLHFIEVKTVSRENLADVTYETYDSYRPEDNIHPWKLQRLARTIQSYLIEKKFSEKNEWQFDIVSVFLNIKDKTAKVNFIKDIIL